MRSLKPKELKSFAVKVLHLYFSNELDFKSLSIKAKEERLVLALMNIAFGYSEVLDNDASQKPMLHFLENSFDKKEDTRLVNKIYTLIHT